MQHSLHYVVRACVCVCEEYCVNVNVIDFYRIRNAVRIMNKRTLYWAEDAIWVGFT